jgi:hypothetical protein
VKEQREQQSGGGHGEKSVVIAPHTGIVPLGVLSLNSHFSGILCGA